MVRRLAPRMSWEQTIAEGRRLLEETEKAEVTISDVNWTWGDLALRIVPPESGTKPTKEERERLQQWAEEIPCPYDMDRLRSFRLTALAYPPEKRAEHISHKVHETIRGREDRFEILAKAKDGLTLTDLYRKLGIGIGARARTSNQEEMTDRLQDQLDKSSEEVLEQVVGNVSDEAAVNLLRQLALSRPDAVAAALHETEVSAAVTAAYSTVAEENQGEAGSRMRSHGFGGMERAGQYYDLLSNLTNMLQKAKANVELLANLEDLSEGQIRGLLRTAKKVEAAVAFTVSRLEGGTQSIDDELAVLLEGED